MTDIIERLRNTASLGIPDFTNSKLLEEAATEIERLRKQCAGLARSAMNNGQEVLLKEAEIESLRRQLAHHKPNPTTWINGDTTPWRNEWAPRRTT